MKNSWFTLLAIVVLFFTNPTKDEFGTWALNKDVKNDMSNEADAAKMAVIRTFASMLLDSAIIRSNYIIFSTYTSSANDQCLVVGALGMFFDFSKEPTKPASTQLAPSLSAVATQSAETVESATSSLLIQQQLEYVTKTMPPAHTETQVEVIISDFLAARNMSLPTIQDVAQSTRCADDEKKYAPLSELSPKERVSNVVNADGDDFAIKCVDFNGDGVKDVFVEVKEGEERFSLYFFDGIKRILEPITFSWEIQGTLSASTQYSEGAYLLSFDDNDKQVLFCHIGYYNWAWLGYVEGDLRNVTTGVVDLEGGVEIVECNENWYVTLKNLDEKWAHISIFRNGAETLEILPKKNFQSVGFVWGSNVNVRSGYGVDYKKKKVLYQFQNGAVVDIIDEQEGWFRVKPVLSSSQFTPSGFDSDKIAQWVKADFIRHIPPFSKNSKPNVQDTQQQSVIGITDPNLTEQAELLVKSGLANATLCELIGNSNNTQSLTNIKALLKAGADANAKDQNGRTALMLAAALANDPELITALIKSGADVNIRDKEEQTPLMLAAMLNSNAKIIASLIDGGAEVNAVDKKGFSALMFASAFTKNSQVIMALVERGANTLHRDSDGRTAFDYVKANKNVKGAFAESSDSAFELVEIGLGQSIIIDDIKITPQNARIDRIVKNNMIFDNTTQSESEYLLVSVTLENVSPGKIIYLQNIWNNTKLVDDFDNIESAKFSDNLSAMWDLISDAIKAAKLRPGEVARDMLIFDIPVRAAKIFTIDSDPKFWKNMGEDRLQEISKSSFRIRFTSDQINKSPLSETISQHNTEPGSTPLLDLHRQAKEIDNQWEKSQKKAMEDLNKIIKDCNESNQRILEDTFKQMNQIDQLYGN
ncbi:hypothetical protein EOM81_07845 [bacterium]|nr:hypothetical protein [bacterium]